MAGAGEPNGSVSLKSGKTRKTDFGGPLLAVESARAQALAPPPGMIPAFRAYFGSPQLFRPPS